MFSGVRRAGLIAIVLAAVCAGCGGLPWVEDTALACQGLAPAGAVVREGDPLAEGEPMAGLDVMAMTPAEVGAEAIERGLPTTWRYFIWLGDPTDSNEGYSECWCVPPPDGRVTDVAYDSSGGLIVFVHSGRTLPAARGQPREGWGCEEAGIG
jgi:hypothetical protein